MSGTGVGHRLTQDSDDLRASVYAGVVVALVVVVAGAFIALTSSPRWTSQASMVVLPASSLGPGQEASFFEYLSQGQIVATFAELSNNAQFLPEAQDEVGIDEADRAKSSVTLSVVPTTSVVLAEATAPTSDEAVALAEAATELARTYFERLEVPFRTQVVAGATGTAEPSGPSTALILIATLVAAAVAGIAVQQATLAFLQARHGHGQDVPAGNEEPEEPNQRVGT